MKLEKQEYLHSTKRLIVGVIVEQWETYACYYKCVKCGKEKINETTKTKGLL
jgi:hypothetical protein